MVWVPESMSILQNHACSICRHFYDSNIVNCHIKQQKKYFQQICKSFAYVDMML